MSRLIRFYGGAISDWLATPVWMIEEFLEQMLVLQAEEQLSEVTTVALGTGSVEKNESRKIIRDLKRQAKGRNAVKKTRPTGTVEDVKKSMEGIGIGVEIIDGK